MTVKIEIGQIWQTTLKSVAWDMELDEGEKLVVWKIYHKDITLKDMQGRTWTSTSWDLPQVARLLT